MTAQTYDDAGQLETVTEPNGRVLTYGYDAAHDLRSVVGNLGNRLEYRYDLKGNRTEEITKDPVGTVRRSVRTSWDLRNRVDAINAAGSLTDLLYDAVGNLKSTTDPSSHPTNHSYDPLDRLTQTLDALSGTTAYGYDAADACAQGLCGPVPDFGISDLYTNAVDSRAERRDIATPFCAAINSRPSTLRPARATPSPRAGRPGRSASTVCEAMQ